MEKKLFLAVVICLFAVVNTSAQESSFNQNDNVVSLGVGFGGNLYSGTLYSGKGYSHLPAFTLSYERCIIGNLFNEQSSLGVGGLVGYTSSKVKDYWTSTDIMVGARAAFHYAFVDNLDTYAGVMAGYNINTWKWHGSSITTHGSGSSSFIYTTFVGARYYLADSFAVFAEVGYGYSILNAGISFKF